MVVEKSDTNQRNKQEIATSQKQPVGFRNDNNGLKIEINISKLHTGLYFVRVLDKGNKPIGSGKFVKE